MEYDGGSDSTIEESDDDSDKVHIEDSYYSILSGSDESDFEVENVEWHVIKMDKKNLKIHINPLFNDGNKYMIVLRQ